MKKNISVTAMITSRPPNLQDPKLLPEETYRKFVIRHYPKQVKNLLERLQHDFSVSKSSCEQFVKTGKLSIPGNSKAEAEINKFMQMRLPGQWRTVNCLSTLRELVNGDESAFKLICEYNLIQIIYWTVRKAGADDFETKEIIDMGAEVVFVESGLGLEVDISIMLPRIKGELLWTIPGGTKFFAPEVAINLSHITKMFLEFPNVALYSDESYSVIYRTSALQQMFNEGKDFSQNPQQIGQLLREAGYGVVGDVEKEISLCELEPHFGGKERFIPIPEPIPESKPSIWRRLFGK